MVPGQKWTLNRVHNARSATIPTVELELLQLGQLNAFLGLNLLKFRNDKDLRNTQN